MSSTRSARLPESSSLHATRQMLDELDALMERMLALPVNELEDVVAPTGETANCPAVSAQLTVIDPPPKVEEWPAPPPPSDFAPSPPPAPEPIPAEIITTRITVPTFTDNKGLETFEAPLAAPQTLLAPPEPPPQAEKVDLLLPVPPRLTRPTTRRRLSLPLWGWKALCWTNQVFDSGTKPLGRLGGWLRDIQGRLVLGWTGITLLGLALLWLLWDWINWPH